MKITEQLLREFFEHKVKELQRGSDIIYRSKDERVFRFNLIRDVRDIIISEESDTIMKTDGFMFQMVADRINSCAGLIIAVDSFYGKKLIDAWKQHKQLIKHLTLEEFEQIPDL